MRKLVLFSFLTMASAILTGCCVGVQRMTPVAPGLVNINLKNNDYTVLAATKGTSTVTSYAGGLVQVIDGNKTRVLGIKFFEDEYSMFRPLDAREIGTLHLAVMVYVWPYGLCYVAYKNSAGAEDRAYYKALAAAPAADAIIEKSFVRQKSGIPLIRTEEEVAVTGKAIKYKSE